jgi:predicted ATPase/DNA-binding SARP family transcriptional activator
MNTFVRLLGQPEISHEGRTTILRPEVRFRLFAVLALRGAPETRDRLAGLFWPDRDNASARRNLRKVVFDAGVFEWSAGVDSARETLAWPVETDVARFERALADGRIEDALSLYRGPLFDGLDDPTNNTFAAFLRGERRRLAQRWRTAALERLETLIDEPASALDLADVLLAADPLDEDAVAAALAAYRTLGNTTEAVRLFRAYGQRLAHVLGIEPSPRLRALVCPTAATGWADKGKCPAARSGLVGRESEMSELAAMLAQASCRLLTIAGPGGIGKSRLAKAALATVEAQFVDGTFWITLDDLEKTEQVAARIATMLGAGDAGNDDPLRVLAGWLRQRRLLLVLDNAERIVALPGLIERLFAIAPGLKLLATSRHRLGCADEWLLPLGGLALPPHDAPPAEIVDYDAVRLFALHARAARPSFDPAAAAVPVGRIVRALGGMPLAIELAAHWLRLLPLGGLETEIGASLDLLERDEEGGERPEHRSVRATFEGSWRMLGAQEQRSFVLLSVFAGAFSRQAANDIAGASLPLLSALADRSLLHADANARFALHPLLRQFASEKCRELGLADAAAAAHAHWFQNLLEQRAGEIERGSRAALDEIERELPDCRAAWRGSIERHDTQGLARCATPFLHFYLSRGRLADGLALFEDAAASLDAERPADRPAAARVLLALAQLQGKRGELDAAAATARRALKLARALSLDDVERGCLEVFLASQWQRGLFPEAKRHFDAGLRRARDDDDDAAAALFLARSGALEEVRGNHARAQAHYAEALQARREQGEPTGLAWLLKDVGKLHLLRGEWRAALAVFAEGLDLCERHGERAGAVHFLLDLAVVHQQLDDPVASDDLCRRALQRACTIGVPAVEGAARLVCSRLSLRRGEIDVAFDQVRAAAALLSGLRDERCGLDCIRSYAEVLATSEASAARTCALGLLNYVIAHRATDPGDRAAARAQLRELAARDCAAPQAIEVEVGVLLRQIATSAAPAGRATRRARSEPALQAHTRPR